MSAASVTMDLVEDWRQIMLDELKAMGYSNPPSKFEEVGIQYFNALKRRILPQPRSVSRAASFTAPAKYVSVIDKIQDMFEAGVDMTPHLSRNILKPNAKDQMMYEWGINHLHLSLTPDPKHGGKLVKGTKELLFVYPTRDIVYFLTVLDHNQWTNQGLVQIIWDNWPDLLRPFVLPGVLDISFNPSGDDRKKLRGAHINALTKLNDGTVLAPPGMGFQSDGTSTQAVTQMIRSRKALQALEKHINGHLDESRSRAVAAGNEFPANPHLRLRGTDEQGSIVEEIRTQSFYSFPWGLGHGTD